MHEIDEMLWNGSEEGGGNITSVCKEDECTDCRDGENDTDW